MSECCKDEKEVKYKIRLVQDDKEVIEVIVDEKKMEETFETLKHGNVIWNKESGYWVNKDRIRYAFFSVMTEDEKEKGKNISLDMDISPDPED